jgi:hypothetical protein
MTLTTRRLMSALVALTWVALVAWADAEQPLSTAEAVKRVGQTVYVEMTVRKAKDRLVDHGLVYLDSEDDFHSPNNLGVVITSAGAAKFKEKGVTDPAAHFLGKTIRVRGEVLIFEKRPYLPVTDPGQIEIAGAKK